MGKLMNQRDLDVLNILWGTDEALTVNEIAARKSGLTQSTVTSQLRKLLEGGFVEVAQTVYSGRVLCRAYRPTEKSREAVLEHFMQEYKNIKNAISPAEIYQAIRDKTPE